MWLAPDQVALNRELDKLRELEERIEKYKGKLPCNYRLNLISERRFRQKMEEYKNKQDNENKS